MRRTDTGERSRRLGTEATGATEDAGAPVIPLAVPHLHGNEWRYLRECVDSGVVSSVGSFVDRFEREFATAVGTDHAVACSSGTAALHVALRLAGAREGALVATSTFSFIASANAAHYTGADLLLVDSESATWNLDTERLHAEVVRRARVGGQLPDIVEAVHVLGHPTQMEPLLALRDEFGILVVEDAAEALGARWSDGALAGRQVGTAGVLGCFSFNGNKTITTGGGGMIVTDDGELARRAKHLTTQARLDGAGYVHDEVGYNYRLPNLGAAVGLAQLEQLPALLDAKRAIARRYRESLADAPVVPPPHADWAEPSCWLYALLLGPDTVDPSRLLRALAGRGVQTRPLWRPLHQQAPYATTPRLGGAVAEHLADRGLALPSSAGLHPDQQQHVIECLLAALQPARGRP